MIKSWYGRAFGLVILLLAACEEERIAQSADPPVEFDSAELLLTNSAGDTTRLGAYLAETEQQTSFGLMERPTLAPDSGMIFLFSREKAPDDAFYMYRTLIPLSIAFIDNEGIIRSIREMEPCTSAYPQWCPYYAPGVPYWSALEVNSGVFSRYGIKVGDRVILRR